MPLYGEAKRAYGREWLRKRRAEYLSGKSCRCGSTTSLEVHHVDPTKKVDHRIWSWSRARLEHELAKCSILCSACHLKETVKALLRPMTHGTNRGYNSGCRCGPCKAYKVQKNAKRVRR